MAVKRILEIPHPLLRQRAKKVRRVDKKLLTLAYDMIETMHEAGGVGLAANQVGELKRLIVIHIPEEEESRIYINPEILHREGEREVEEGCLSHVGYRAMINRSLWVRFGALDHTEKAIKIKADGLLAQAMEHEVDHLNGILYLDHLEDHSKIYKVDEYGEPIEDEPSSDAAESSDSTPDNEDEDIPATLKVN